ncbi:MAG: hypothetical protein KJO69_09825 [Gammaproteobacteria bacterium]|nr:hypothetical protein [Gammaproteobacteria bacterium]
MAQTTTAALQAALDTYIGHDAGTMSPIRILQEDHDDATYSRWYVVGDVSRVSTPVTIRVQGGLWVKTTVANTAAQQALEITAAIAANPTVDADAQV